MRPPTRYTTSRPSVNSTRLRRSETVKMFFSESASIFGYVLATLKCRPTCRPTLCQHLCRAAGRGDLLRRLAAELVRADRQLLADVAARQDLDPARARHEPVLAQQL